jgi:hypothetical protein
LTFVSTLPLLAAMAPYPPDAATLHLWHLDEPANADHCTNAVAGGVTLTAIANGATLGNPALPGFGAAASTYDGGPIATSPNPMGPPPRRDLDPPAVRNARDIRVGVPPPAPHLEPGARDLGPTPSCATNARIKSFRTRRYPPLVQAGWKQSMSRLPQFPHRRRQKSKRDTPLPLSGCTPGQS